MNKTLLIAALAALSISSASVHAGGIAFDKSWKEQKFSLFSKNKYSFKGNSLGVASNGAVSMTYKAIPKSLWGANKASWAWAVQQGVPATDLRVKGGDDRNLAVYAVFLPEAEAAALQGKSIVKLLGSDAARVLVYVWGGNHKRGQVLASPYLGKRGKTIVLRGAGTGNFSENVNLHSDYKRAFGGTPGAFVGIAVSADSDDTDTKISASVSGLNVN